MKRLTFAILVLVLIPTVSFAEGFYTRMVKSERRSWLPFQPDEILSAAFPDVPEDPEAVPASSEYHLTINLPARRLFLYEGDRLLKVYPVAVGTNRHRTPVGPRFLTNITWNPWWYPPPYSAWAKGEKPTPPGPNNPLGPVKMSLGGDIFLHATNRDYTVGTPASHGCMRMHRKDALELAWFFQSRLTDQTDEDLRGQYKSHPTSSFYVPLAEKVPVDIVYERVTLRGNKMTIHPDIYRRVGDLEQQVLSQLSTIGIAPWEVDPAKIEGLEHLPNSTSVAIADLL